MCRNLLTFSSGHVLLQLQFPLAQLQHDGLYAVLADQLRHLYSPDTNKELY